MVKCRRCGQETTMHHSSQKQITKEHFLIWVNEHVSFPIRKACSCEPKMILLHDIVGFNIED